MAQDNLKQKTAKGIVWSGIEKFGTQGVTFVFNILIARILMPEDYGLVAMISVFIAICKCFVDSGFASALIRKQDRTDDDYDTVFYFNIAISVVSYLLLFFCAPLIARFYQAPELIQITRLVGLNLVISSFAGIHCTRLSINIDFRKKALAAVSCVLISGSGALVLAKAGYGVMALVAQGLISSVVFTLMMWILDKWRPRLVFSLKSFKEMFSFGSKLLATSLINTIYENIYTLVIGKFFSKASLGLYGKADNLANFPSGGITSILQSVTFPVLSSIQKEEDRLKITYKKFINLSAYIIFPLMIGLAAVSDPFVRLLLTDKWEKAIPLLQLICFSRMWYPIHAINLNILMVKGQSGYFLRIEIIKKIIGILILAASVPFGLIGMCIGSVLSSLIALPINTYYTKRLIDLGFFAQMKGFLHILVLSLVMGVAVYFSSLLFTSNVAKLTVGIVLGIGIYVSASYLFKFPEWNDLVDLIKKK